MNTKIDLNNLEKEKIGKIEDRLCDLIDDPGDVFLWTGILFQPKSQDVSAAKKTRRSTEF